MQLNPDQIQKLIDAEKNSTNGPLPYTPVEAEEAALAQDRANVKIRQRKLEENVFYIRDAVNRAMRNRETQVVLHDKSFSLFEDTPEHEALLVVINDLQDAGWFTHHYAKVMYENSSYLMWSTKRFTWFDKFLRDFFPW